MIEVEIREKLANMAAMNIKMSSAHRQKKRKLLNFPFRKVQKFPFTFDLLWFLSFILLFFLLLQTAYRPSVWQCLRLLHRLSSKPEGSCLQSGRLPALR